MFKLPRGELLGRKGRDKTIVCFGHEISAKVGINPSKKAASSRGLQCALTLQADLKFKVLLFVLIGTFFVL